MIKIIVDGFGGDNSPHDVVKGAVEATKKNLDLHIIITGKESSLLDLLKKNEYDPSRFTIINAPEIVSVDSSPTLEFKLKPNSSLVKAFDMLRKEDDIKALVSGGSSGAVLTGALFKLGRIHGVSRPAFCPVLPAMNKRAVLLCDSGANVDCKPMHVGHFAIMAREYAKIILGIKNPAVGLLNIGVESEKGNVASKEYYEYLSKMKGINFIGNIEGNDIMSNVCDVVVSDGFIGNVALKSAEGTMKFMSSMLKDEIMGTFWGKIGAATLMKKPLRLFKQHIKEYTDKGAIVLGCKKLVVKSHGNSNDHVFCNAILQAADMAKARLCDKIEKSLSKYDFVVEGE